ncbi:MAG TPA: GvpL/GvpF family gas vesicle protein [Blastocatellia bacterium]|nr:GvpL/GvpF family gas vesicle protein [Blastocatellia bacterium]
MNTDSSKKRKSSAPDPDAGRALYIYCIGEREALRKLFDDSLPEAIEEGAVVEMIEAGDLAAVSSAVSRAEYGEEALQIKLADPVWTAVRAMRHEKIVEHFASRATIIPLRFATIYLSRERIVEMISERREELALIIERLRGREEWAVNLYCDFRALTEAIATTSPRLRELGERADRSSPGQAYLLRKKLEAMKTDEARAETKRVAGEVKERLAALSEASTSLRVMKGEPGEQGEVVAKLAFLISRDRFEEFRDAAEELAREHRSAFRIEMTGPWPAYNFSHAAGD